MWWKCKGFPNITWLSKLAFCQQDMPLAPDNNNSLSLKEKPIFLSITKDTLGLMAECSCQLSANASLAEGQKTHNVSFEEWGG